MKRIFHIREWESTLITFEKLSLKKSYAARFRLEHQMFVAGRITIQARFKGFLENILGLLSEVRYIFYYQLFNSKTIDSRTKYFFHFANSNSYLKTLLPIANMFGDSGNNLIIFCPPNHYKVLKTSLNPNLAANLMPYEQVKTHPNRFFVCIYLIRALILTFNDIIWFALTPVKRSFSTSFSFGKYALIHYYFESFWINWFNSVNKTYLAADDKQLWEASILDIIKNTPAQSIVFQHGKISDLYYPTPAKKFYAWGHLDEQKLLLEFGAKKDEITTTGSPYFDKIFNDLKCLNIRPSNKRQYISFLGQPYYRVLAASTPFYREALQWFYKLSQNPDFKHKFIIKPHPHDDIAYYHDRPNNISLVDANIIEVLEDSFFTITIDSTSMIEASVTQTPTIQALPLGNNIFIDDSHTKISLKAETYEEFEVLALKLYNDKVFYQSTIDDSTHALHLYFSNLGHSLEKIRELLILDNNR